MDGAFRGKYGTMKGRVAQTRPLRVSGPGHVNMGLYYYAPDNNLFVGDKIETKLSF